MESNPGIYQRLINFILRTMRHPSALPVSTHVPVESAGSSTIPNGSMHSEILVDFRHTKRRAGDAILDPKKDGLVHVITSDQTKLPNGVDRKGKGVKKTVTIMDSVKKKKKEGADESGDHDETKPRAPRPHWPLLSIESNINEKSDAYISSRKKAMGRNYTLDQENHGQ
ncbi:hypothetical protein ACS0TY_007682 [Phlomoides rotata]